MTEVEDIGQTIVYLAHGDRAYHDEAVFSLLTARAHDDDDGTRYVVYADQPQYYAGLDAIIVELTDHLKIRWSGPSDYIHGIKMRAHIDALERFGGSVIFVDTDTYFLRSPQHMFDRVRPGRSILHLAEGRLGEIKTPDFKAIRSLVSAADAAFSPNEIMWNSGVIGLHVADKHFLERSVAIVEDMRRQPQARAINQLEQFVSGALLSRHTEVAEAADTVFHYWPSEMKTVFRTIIPQALAVVDAGPLRERGRTLLSMVPRTSFQDRTKMATRTMLRRAGVRVPGLRTSV